MRIAALDLGSNSFHALIADIEADGSLEVVTRAKRMPRIGDAIFRTGEISHVARKAAIEALAELVPLIERSRPRAIQAVATSAVREARNGRAFIAEVRERFGLDVRAISGDEEARLSYTGASARSGGFVGRTTLFDLGGGSLEVIVGDGPRILHTASAPLGVLRAIAEQPLSDPATPRELRALEHWARRHIAAFLEPVRKFAFGDIVLCAGTARSARSVARALGQLPARSASDRLDRKTLRLLIDELAPLPIAERRDVPGLDPARVDLIVHGAVVLDAVLALVRADDARVCRAALREGLILEQAARMGLIDERPQRRRASRADEARVG